ncbi:MAG: SiaB family protein kinase [Vicingaceae bacterium]
MLDIFDFYDKMDKHNIMLSFKGNVTSELLTSILQIMESQMDNLDESPKMRRKVYNILVECLQNLYHHIDEKIVDDDINERNAIFAIGKVDEQYSIITGNYMLSENVSGLKDRLDRINAMSRDDLKTYYKEVLSNGVMSEKGGGGLGMIDIARKSGSKLDYNFSPIDDKYHFFSLSINVIESVKQNS